jgi:hypothetical protein
MLQQKGTCFSKPQSMANLPHLHCKWQRIRSPSHVDCQCGCFPSGKGVCCNVRHTRNARNAPIRKMDGRNLCYRANHTNRRSCFVLSGESALNSSVDGGPSRQARTSLANGPRTTQQALSFSRTPSHEVALESSASQAQLTKGAALLHCCTAARLTWVVHHQLSAAKLLCNLYSQNMGLKD